MGLLLWTNEDTLENLTEVERSVKLLLEPCNSPEVWRTGSEGSKPYKIVGDCLGVTREPGAEKVKIIKPTPKTAFIRPVTLIRIWTLDY